MKEELRFALVMNGGVSLAVWMGGATAEFWRLVTSREFDRHPVYNRLLELTETSARVDVISGTSAGGINGAALALALVHQSDFMRLRATWTEVGDFLALLRNPMDVENPGSILKGDEFFLPELEKALQGLVGDGKNPRAKHELPIDLKLTATMLSGAQGRNVDDLGADLHDVDYRAYFHFSRRNAEGEDDFVSPDAVQKLARAARSTASFPFAFEPSKVGPTKVSRLRTYSHDNLEQTRYVIDGGILDNKPFRGARDAIFDMPHKTKVRRVMAYMNPDPGDGPPFDFQKNKAAPMPPMSSVVAAAVMGIPTSQSIADQLLEIRKHNEEVRARRSNVQTLAVAHSSAPKRLLELAARLYPSYLERRRVATFEKFVFEPLTLAASRDPNYAKLMERFGRNTHDAMRRQFLDTDSSGWLPPAFNSRNPAGIAGSWGWGMFPVEFAITVAMNLLRLVQTANDKFMLLGLDCSDRWEVIYACIRRIHLQRVAETVKWRLVVRENLNELAATKEQDVDMGRWHQRLIKDLFAITRDQARRNVCESVARDVAAVCRDAASDAERLWRHERNLGKERAADIKTMRALATVLTGVRSGRDVDAAADGTLSALLAMEVVEFAFVDHQDMRSDTLIELVQVSANTASPLGGPEVASKKLRGVQVAHFGAFYKRSWRANDWTYGRLDSSSRIVDVLLNPERLFLHYRTGQPNRAAWLLNDLRDLALAADGANAQLQVRLRADWESANSDKSIAVELSFLNRAVVQLPDSLPHCARALKRRLHYEIAIEEMGHIADAVEIDQSKGASTHGSGYTLMCRLHRIRAIADVDQAFARNFPTLPAQSSPEAARDLVAAGLLADEGFVETELGSDLMTTVFAHTMATTQSTLAGKASKLGPVTTFFKSLHLPVFGFYVAATLLAKQSATAAAVIALLLGVGITLVILSVASSALPDGVGTLGWAALCAGILMASAASKRTAMWILVPLLAGMCAFAAITENRSLWILTTLILMFMALINRWQFPVALAALIGAGYYAHLQAPPDRTSPTLLLSLVVALALTVAYIHGKTRRKRNWRAMLREALRPTNTPTKPASQVQMCVASVGLAALLVTCLAPIRDHAVRAAGATGIEMAVLSRASIDPPLLGLASLLLLAAIVGVILRRSRFLDGVSANCRGTALFGTGAVIFLGHWFAPGLIIFPPGGSQIPLAPTMLAVALMLLLVAFVRMCIGFRERQD